jgi:capsular polysaccharide biosynthesis protein
MITPIEIVEVVAPNLMYLLGMGFGVGITIGISVFFINWILSDAVRLIKNATSTN